MAYRDSRRSRLIPILFTIVAILAITYFLAGRPLSAAKEEWRNSNYDAAIETLDRGAKFRLRPADYEHLYTVTYLSKGDREGAEPWLRRMADRSPDWISVIDKEEVGKRLISLGLYDSFLEYDTAVDQKGSSSELVLYRAAAELGANRIRQAETTFSTVNRGDVEPERYEALKNAIEQRKGGSYPLILDREGKTIASYQVDNQDLVAVNSSFAALVDETGGPTSFEGRLPDIGTTTTVQTTLDAQMQRAALDALGNRRGSLVAIDPATHEILALASTPGPGDARNLAFAGQYEPGSVIKILTSMKTLDSNVELSQIFPLDCRGFIVIEGKQFFDWAQHKEVPGLDDAMAVSCNVAFAKMGLALGTDALIGNARKAGFGGSVDLGLYEVGLGQIVGDVRTDYQTANLAIGLDHYLTNTLHLAMIADAIANRGLMTEPTLLQARRSILGEEMPIVLEQQEPSRIASEEAVARTIQAMRTVVTHPAGTGRRASIEGLDYAMKTGTAGDRESGYDAVIVAIAPAENPKIAFALIAEDVGKAEIEGAQVTRAFLEAIKDRLR